MGTRHLTCVRKDGEFKVAQYGQWDGYPEHTGVGILQFLQKINRDIFEEKVSQVLLVTEEQLEEMWREVGAEGDLVSLETSQAFKQKHPELHRDTGHEILQIIYESEKPIMVQDSSEFGNDSLFCEWAYIIDLDNNKLEVHSNGFQEHPVTFNLNDLPSKEEFLESFER
ncbi:MAG: hypothetical protein ACOCQR_00750 [bacterium]